MPHMQKSTVKVQVLNPITCIITYFLNIIYGFLNPVVSLGTSPSAVVMVMGLWNINMKDENHHHICFLICLEVLRFGSKVYVSMCTGQYLLNYILIFLGVN